MRMLLVTICCGISIFLGAQQPLSSTTTEIVFRSVNVVAMDQEKVVEKQDVVVKNGVITAIGATGTVKYANNATVIDGNGKWLMPGLAEMHAHVPPMVTWKPAKK